MARHHGASRGNDGRLRLYRRGMHVGLRIAHGFMLFLALVGLVGVAFDPPRTLDLRTVAAPALVGVFLWLATRVFRTREVYGSALGLEYRRDGRWNLVRWSDVGLVEYTWWSFNRVGRVASLTVADERRPILFFANDRTLADLRRLRDEHLAARPARR